MGIVVKHGANPGAVIAGKYAAGESTARHDAEIAAARAAERRTLHAGQQEFQREMAGNSQEFQREMAGASASTARQRMFEEYGIRKDEYDFRLGEGAVADWSAVYLANTLGTGPGLAAAGFAAFSLTMTAGRLAGDYLTRRLGPVLLVRLGGAVAALGLGLGLFVAQPAAALAGFACAGLGFSIVFPIAVSAAGNARDMKPGPAIAAVSTTGYFGFLAGPPAIGFLAEAIGLGGALYVVVALSAAVAVLAPAVGKSRKT